MKQFKKNKRILAVFGVVSIVLVTSLLYMLLFFYHSYQTSLSEESRNHLLEVSSQTSGSLDNIFIGNLQLLMTIETAFLTEYQYFDGDINPLLNQLRILGEALGDSADFFLLNESCLAYMPDGTHRSFALVEDIRTLTDKGDDFSFLSVDANGQGSLYMVSPLEDTLDLNGERIIGLGAHFDISNISFLLNQQLFGAPVSCYLLDEYGALIYQNNSVVHNSSMQPFYYIQQFGSFEDTSYDEIFDEMMVQRKDGVASYTLDGQEFYITYNNLTATPWVLAVSYEKEVVNSSMNKFSNSFFFVCVVVFTCIVLILLALSMLVYRNAKFAYQRALSEQERHLSELAEQVYDNQILVDLETMQFKHYRFREESYIPLPDTGDYITVIQSFAMLLIPSDRMVFEKLFAPELLCEHADNDENKPPQSIVVCMKDKGRWIQLTRYLHKEQGRSFATIMSTDITEEMELKKQLHQKNLELEQANEAKSLFLANMSHDIRTPMNAITGMTRIASANMNDPERIKDCLEKIEFSSHHLLSLINDVLDMSKIESGKLEINEVDFDLSEQVTGITSIIAAQAKERSQEFDVHIHNIRHEKLIGDPLRFSQILINILGNSIKFTPVGGYITLDITELPMKGTDETRFTLTVTDTGIGMSEDFLPHLFDAFSQETNGQHTHTKGTGLGMTICNSLVSLMDGSIAVESEPGTGTCFTVELPFNLPEVSAAYEQPSKLHVLFVDANAETCIETTRNLEDMGLRAHYALSGSQAIHMAETAHQNNDDYQLIIIDWSMPNMSGIETAARIRETVCCDLPIIMLSVYDWSDVKQEALTAGIDEFISKPLFKGTLHKKLMELNNRYTIFNLSENPSKSEMTKGFNLNRHNKPNQHNELERHKPLSGRRFLLVDDNELNREIARELLIMNGAEVEEAFNGAQALDTFSTCPVNYYDVILMDVQMPVMNGYEATHAIRALERPDAQSILILAVTADAFSEDIKRTHQAGMNAHITKPIDFDLLETLITKLFREKEEEKEEEKK